LRRAVGTALGGAAASAEAGDGVDSNSDVTHVYGH